MLKIMLSQIKKIRKSKNMLKKIALFQGTFTHKSTAQILIKRACFMHGFASAYVG